MAIQILALHWKAVRWGLLPFVVAAFALPLVSVQGLGGDASTEGYAALLSMQALLPLFPIVAAGLGVTLGLSAWNWDHQGNHVYALSLPVGRSEYVILKFGAGALLALVPTAALLSGSLLASGSLDLPPGLHTYPFDLSLRFLLAALLTYALTFALAAGTLRTAVIVITAVIALPLVGSLALDVLGEYFPALEGLWLFERLLAALVEWPGPFHVFAGNWTLIDV